MSTLWTPYKIARIGFGQLAYDWTFESDSQSRKNILKKTQKLKKGRREFMTHEQFGGEGHG